MTDWLSHRWEITKLPGTPRPLVTNCGAAIDGIPVFWFFEEGQFEKFVACTQPEPLDVVIARTRGHAREVIIEASGQRLGRIPPHLWPDYDAISLGQIGGREKILSAKARAMFPDHERALVIAQRAVDGR